MRNHPSAGVFVDPTLADSEECGHVVDGEELVQLRRKLLGGGHCDFWRRVVSHGMLNLGAGKHHQYNDWPLRIVRFATLSRR